MREALHPLLLVALPLLGAFLVAILPAHGRSAPRALAMLTMLAVLALASCVFIAFDGAANASGFDFNQPWMRSLGVHLHLAVDGFNVYLVLLSALLFPVVLACTWNSSEARSSLYLALLLLIEGSLLGTFLSQNLMLLFICWEAVLIPMGVLIYVFGGAQRRSAAVTFFLYTLAGSVLLLAGVIALGAQALVQTGRWTFELDVLQTLTLDRPMQLFVFTAVMLACLVKCPLVPFHAWLPRAYHEAPAGGAALMAGALSKMGAFGILKLALPLAPAIAPIAAPYLAALAVISILYGALLALVQREPRRLVAYASLSHMGYIVLGLFTFNQSAVHGALLQMLSHGLAVAGLFLLVGRLESHETGQPQAARIAAHAPRFAVLLMLFVLTSLALPLTSGFTAEFLILFGAFTHGLESWRTQAGALPLVTAVLAASGMVLGAAYMLRFARATVFAPAQTALRDAGVREIAALCAPLLLIGWIGVAPGAFMSKVQRAAAQISQPAPTPDSPPAAFTSRSAHEQ